MDAKSVRNIYSIIAVAKKHTAKLHHVGSLYILTYDARKLKHKKLSLDCVKNQRYVYIVFSHKLWYMLLGTEFVFLLCIRRVLGGASRSIHVSL